MFRNKNRIPVPRRLPIHINNVRMNNVQPITDYNINIKIIDMSGLIIDTNLGFIILRHVNNILTNNYWKESYNCIREYYPNNKILIIDDNSNYTYINIEDERKLQNCEIIKSEYIGRGELLPYYYFYKTKFTNKVVIIHDSVFIKKYIDFNEDIAVKFLWHFNNDKKEDSSRVINYLNLLNNNNLLIKEYNSYKWYGCFGVMSVIKIDFLINLVEKYNFFKLLDVIKNRKDRSTLERIYSILCYIENNNINIKTYFNDIHSYCKWSYNFNEYMNEINNKNIKNIKSIIKVWSGR